MIRTTKILLIDDHTLFRSGLKALLARQGEFEVIGEASDGISGVRLAEQLRPDIVLLDLTIPELNGKEVLSRILRHNPQQRVVILTVSEEHRDLTDCIRLGAKGFLLKNINAAFLIESLRKVVKGDSVFSPEMTAQMMRTLLDPTAPRQTDDALKTLTSRELEVLGYLAVGHSNKIIARQLRLAESTVKVHVQNILRKLNLSSRVQAAVYAVQHNIEVPKE